MVTIGKRKDGCQLRVGIHCGPVLVLEIPKGLDLMGKDVGKTTLVHSSAEPGQILISPVPFGNPYCIL